MSDASASPVLQPVTIGDLQLQNRIVMAPLTRSRSSEDGVPPDFAADYYGQRAGAGLIITEATNISAQARGYAMTPGDARTPSLSRAPVIGRLLSGEYSARETQSTKPLARQGRLAVM